MSWPRSPRTRMRPIGPGSPMRFSPRPRTIFVGGQSARSGRCPSRVWMTIISRARAASSTRLHGAITACSGRHVVAERFAEAARLDEVALHVDDDQRGGARIELELVRLGIHFGNAHQLASSLLQRISFHVFATAFGSRVPSARHVAPNIA